LKLKYPNCVQILHLEWELGVMAKGRAKNQMYSLIHKHQNLGNKGWMTANWSMWHDESTL
jgi:hypothetical protein